MTRAEWQSNYGISDEKMAVLDAILMIFSCLEKKAKIIKIWDTRILGRWGNVQK